jgi:hypothetical protein
MRARVSPHQLQIAKDCHYNNKDYKQSEGLKEYNRQENSFQLSEESKGGLQGVSFYFSFQVLLSFHLFYI